jgi:hypothetical protein
MIQRVVIALLVFGLFPSSASAEWNQYRGDPERTARGVWENARPTGAVEWRVTISDQTTTDDGAPVVDTDGFIYVPTTPRTGVAPGGGAVSRISSYYPSGTLRWTRQLGDFELRNAPVIRRDGRLIVVGFRGRGSSSEEAIFYLDASSGRPLASNMGSGRALNAAPLLDPARNETYVFRYLGFLLRFNPPLKTVREVHLTPDLEGGTGVEFPPCGFPCKFPIGPSPSPQITFASPAPTFSSRCGDIVGPSFGGYTKYVVRFWPHTGTRSWGADGNLAVVTAPVVGQTGRAYLLTRDGDRLRLEARDQNGDRVWRGLRDLRRVNGPPALGVDPRGESGDPIECTRLEPDGTKLRIRDETPWRDRLYVSHLKQEDDNDVGVLRAYGPRGDELWSRRLDDIVPTPPVVLRSAEGLETVVVASGPRLTAYRQDGSSIWRRTLDSPVRGAPAVSHGRIYVATQTSLYAIR